MNTTKEQLLRSALEEFQDKPYAEASTDRITANAGCSKGILFHHYGSKKGLYLSCLEQALELLATPEELRESDDFYELVFEAMHAKFAQCRKYPLQTRFLQTATREQAKEILQAKDQLITSYLTRITTHTAITWKKAVETLNLKEEKKDKAAEALQIYMSAIVTRYLMQYQNRVEEFFASEEQIRAEFMEYMEFMLRGIVKDE